MENRVIKSYVWHKEKCFFISTITKVSSAEETPEMQYNETIVWEYDWDKRERDKIIHQGDDAAYSIATHINICKQLFETGRIVIF